MTTSYAAALALRCVLTACPDEEEGGAEAKKPSRDAVETSTAPAAVDEELRHELLAMLERDQAERMGTGEGTSLETDQDRTNRLEEIVDEHGPASTGSSATARRPPGRSPSTPTSTRSPGRGGRAAVCASGG